MNLIAGPKSTPRRAAFLLSGLVAAGVAIIAASWPTRAADSMSVVEELQAKEEIRQQLVLFGLLAEGDGVNPRDTDALMDRIMAPDVLTEQYFSDGTPAFPPRRGRGDNKKYSQPRRDLTRIGEQHYTLGIYFDELTPTTARTRSQHLFLTVWKDVPHDGCKSQCDGVIQHIRMNNYFDTWAKTPEGWLKTKTVIHTID